MQFRHYPRLLLAVMLMLFVSIGLMNAQEEENLLTNPSFEAGFSNGVATGWTSWVNTGSAPAHQDAPIYLAGADADDNGLVPQIRTGSNSQAMFSFIASHNAGIYQTVEVGTGSEVRFNIYAFVFSNNSADVSSSENPGGVSIRVGIDPNGGTDPFGDDVVYSEFLTTYDSYTPHNVIVEATSDEVTVFVQSLVTEPVQNTIVYLDDATLNITPESVEPVETEEVEETEEVTEEPTEEVTEEVVETEEPEETEEAEETEEVVETEEVTEEPTEEETQEVGETDEPEETQEAEETQEVVETEEPEETEEVVETEEPTEEATEEETETEEAPQDPTPTREGVVVTEEVETEEPTEEATEEEVETEEPTEEPTEEVTQEPTDTPISDEFPGQISYVVQRGDTVGALATRYGSSIDAIISANGLDDSALIFVGQTLVIPVPIVPDPVTPSPTETEAPATETEQVGTGGPVGGDAYVVQVGDTLFSIARQFNTSVGTLVQLNGITNPNQIFVGQTLTLPGASEPQPTPVPTETQAPVTEAPATEDTGIIPPAGSGGGDEVVTYVVQPGDNLYRIALRFGVSLVELAELNGIDNYNFIFVGQTLTIPQ